MAHEDRTTSFAGRLLHLKGCMAQLEVSGGSDTIGRSHLRSAEAPRTKILLKAIQNANIFLSLPFVRDIWFPATAEPPLDTFSNPIPLSSDIRLLNVSQRLAVEAVLSNEPSQRLVLIQEPPGTGKTTVIAAAVTSIMTVPDYTERNI
ncbi:hypothetical protein P691DRAFT_772741 [Macrolepiota fuliginosa MF-IS2]|uniref:DNA2/NAM7 helicase helicase domain-containing protein n=1 Tax=Macrolepiota fuliginosa MF-IS2 TaxID=1400762 RepID=A0A9P5XK57_9AGAR|nr:hypothetical protein P691DRAFT_772741 [Macrolepiota fuliginosa MF-IS2]